ncbi:hypothetical protein NLG97_g3164 [Lecanicillium saksenae]|uniref:Uncharacterized protein n=1 Tax=Lecanicillium saksenae TaxID=468837 RepID=A0ACC1R0S1_9HYPO|nr:hypothetical protein NLG97_g3164 [Lecanicillium saksenae]
MPIYKSSSLLLLIYTAIQFTASRAYRSKNPNVADLPGHSDLYKIKGPSGFGCQVADWEVIPYRTPGRKGEDDGSLWTGETVVFVSRATSDRGAQAKTVCTGNFRLATVFWLGPYLQGQNGTGGNVAMGLLAFETNSTNKLDAWQAYRPCSPPFESDPGVSQSSFKFLAGAQFGQGRPPSMNATFGLEMARPVKGNMTTEKHSSPSVLYFNGTLNEIKESHEYFGGSRYGTDFFSFHSYEKLNCTKVAEGDDPWRAPDGSLSNIVAGSVINGSLAADKIDLEMSSTSTSKVIAGVENTDESGNIKPTATRLGYTIETLHLVFNGQFDSQNSSQKIIINTTSEEVITFSGAGQRIAPNSLLLTTAIFIFTYKFL